MLPAFTLQLAREHLRGAERGVRAGNQGVNTAVAHIRRGHAWDTRLRVGQQRFEGVNHLVEDERVIRVAADGEALLVAAARLFEVDPHEIGEVVLPARRSG